MPEEQIKVSAELPTDLVQALQDLARQRGVSANTVLQQAIATEKYISEEIGAGSKILVEKPDRSFRKLTFGSR